MTTAERPRAAVYCEGAFTSSNGKTAHGLVRRSGTLIDINENPQAKKEQSIAQVFDKIKLDKEMQKRKLKSRLLLQVHDELIFEVPEDELAEMQKLAPDIMSTSIKLSLPLKVDVKTGRNWGQLE